MRRLQLAALAVVLAAIVAGCGSARPVKYYILDTGTAPSPSTSANAPIPATLLVSRVVTSHLYRDDRLVYGAGNFQLGTYSDQRWAQTPADMVQDALVNSLRATGQYRSVLRIGSGIHGDYIVRSTLYSLYEMDQPTFAARFSMRVELFDPKSSSTVWIGNYAHDEPVSGKTVAAVVEAMDKNVRAGMQEFTSGIGQYLAGHPPQPTAH
jgi:ABC-type uncharacterized transport system auxiliary subunit